MFNEISSTNLVEETGNTWNYEVEPYKANRAAVQQWHAVVNLSKQYKYIGLTKAAAVAGAQKILSAYQVAISWSTVSVSAFCSLQLPGY